MRCAKRTGSSPDYLCVLVATPSDGRQIGSHGAMTGHAHRVLSNRPGRRPSRCRHKPEQLGGTLLGSRALRRHGALAQASLGLGAKGLGRCPSSCRHKSRQLGETLPDSRMSREIRNSVSPRKARRWQRSVWRSTYATARRTSKERRPASSTSSGSDAKPRRRAHISARAISP